MVRKGMVADGSNPVAISSDEFRDNIAQALDLVDGIIKRTGLEIRKTKK